MFPIVARFRVLEFTDGLITDERPVLYDWHHVHQDAYAHEFFIYVETPGPDPRSGFFEVNPTFYKERYRVTFLNDWITLAKKNNHGQYVYPVSYRCTYQFEWNVLNCADIDFIITCEARRHQHDPVSVHFRPDNTTPRIWLRQIHGAQVLATRLPTDLQRHVFGFLWKMPKPGVYSGHAF